VTEKVFYNTCPAAGCHQLCALKVHVEEGRIRKVESADYPGDPAARSVCLKGLAAPRLVYHSDRLKYPLKRIGERGEGKWQRISWDEALDTIAAKLLEVKEKYGSQSVKIMAASSSHVGVLMGRLMAARFANAWGAGGVFEAKSHWLADMRVPAASLLTLGDSGQTHRPRDVVHSKMIIVWGGNPAETHIPNMRFILDAKDQGAKLVVIGPLFDATAAKADRWIAIRPATDAALAMAMIHVIIREGLYDRDYVMQHTVAPFLVSEKDGRFLRQDGKPAVWDETAQESRPFDAAALPALQGTFNTGGGACKTAFHLLTEKAAYYTPERAEEIIGVPAEEIRSLAREYAAAKPATIRMYYGVSRTLNSTLSCRAMIILAALTGNIGVPGGGAPVPQVFSPIVLDEQAVANPPGAPGVQVLPGTPSSMRGWAAIREGKPYPIKVFFNAYRNDLQCDGHLEGYREIFAPMELVVVSDIFMTRTARYADIVLPDATIYERDDMVVNGDYLQLLEKAIEPLHEARTALDVWSALAERVGLGEYFRHTPQDYMRMLLASGHPSVDGITFERLEAEKIVRGNLPSPPEIPFARGNFPTPSGRIEFYNESLVEFGEELPFHRETLESPRRSPLAGRYPLIFLSAKVRATMHSIMANVDWMQEVSEEPLLHINPADAQKRAVADGDWVVAFNDRGRVKLKARLSEAVPPGTVNVPHGWWPERFAEGHYSDLLHRIDDLTTIDPVLESETVVGDSRACSGLIHFDCLAEVVKA
jgi:molybdopterin-containing oxidoreductase family molybdopterin binding subunit